MTVIILTSTVFVKKNIDCVYQNNPSDRINTYLKSIRQWLYNTNFKIILIENSGYSFDELNSEKEQFKDRFEFLNFDESNLKEAENIRNNSSKGLSELFSINYAFFFSKIIKPNDFIIKVTARFFIPELENYLSNFNLNEYECLTQQNRDRCEMVGCNYNCFKEIFNINIFDTHVEYVYKHRTSLFKKILVCKTFNIEETQRGGLPHKFNTI
jgi:hypothetical protein